MKGRLQVKSKHSVEALSHLALSTSHSLKGMLSYSKDTRILLFPSFIMLSHASVHWCCCLCVAFPPAKPPWQTPTTPSNLSSIIISSGKSLIPPGKLGLLLLCASTGPPNYTNLVCGHCWFLNLFPNWELLQARGSLIISGCSYFTLGPKWAKQMFREYLLKLWTCLLTDPDSQQTSMGFGSEASWDLTAHKCRKNKHMWANKFLPIWGLAFFSLPTRWQFLIFSVFRWVFVHTNMQC